jgi:acyl-CoA thioester hydrolase
MPPTRPTRAAFRHFQTFTTRWRDNDMYGHLNNAVFYEYVDTVVNGWLIGTGALSIPDGPVICLVAETGCVFFGPLGFPGRIEAGLRVDRVGTSAIVYGVGLFAEGASEAAAEARFVHVCVDSATRRPVPAPEALRAALAALQVQSGA